MADAVRAPGVRLVLVIWLGLMVFSVLTGLLNVVFGWNGLSFSVARLSASITVDPPFVVAVLLAIWLGPAWGIVPLYRAKRLGRNRVEASDSEPL